MNRMIYLLLAPMWLGILLFAGCTGASNPWPQRPGPKVLAYFPPLYSLATTVAGNDAQVISLLTFQGPHDFEPSSRDVRMVAGADVFLTIGLGLDNAVARKMIAASNNKSLKHVALGERLPKTSLHEGNCSCGHKHAPNENLDAGHHHVEYDPHVWLAPAEAASMALVIADELSIVDPSHADGYRARATALAENMVELLKDGNELLLAKKEKPKVISHHGALHYFSRSFGIEVVESLESPGQEPSAKKITKLVEACQKHGTRLIAVEPQYPSNTGAKVLLEELKRKGIDAAFVEIDPLETAAPSDLTPDYYERKVRENIKRLAAVLK